MDGDLGFVVRILWNWGKTREERKDMTADRNPDPSFTAYDSIHEIKINTQSKWLHFFYQNHSIIFKNHYMAIYRLKHVHYTCNY